MYKLTNWMTQLKFSKFADIANDRFPNVLVITGFVQTTCDRFWRCQD